MVKKSKEELRVDEVVDHYVSDNANNINDKDKRVPPEWYKMLRPEEKEIYENVAYDVLLQAENELALYEVRIYRLMEAIKHLKDLQEQGQEYVSTSIITEKGFTGNGPVNTSRTEQVNISEQVRLLEETLTRVQEKKVKVLELKHKVESSGPDVNTEIYVKAYVEALNKEAEKVWKDDD